MLLSALFPPKRITPAQINDFFRYSEVSKCTGRTDKKNQFGSNISFEYTLINGHYHYTDIYLYSNTKWAHVSLDNGTVKYQYTENSSLRALNCCPVITDAKTIALITKLIMQWYKELGLPHSIHQITAHSKESPHPTVIKEIEISPFDDEFPPIIRVFNNKTTSLVFGVFPPRNTKLSQQQIYNFDKLLSAATGKKVIQDDRETFVIYDDSESTLSSIVSLLQSFSNEQ